MDVGRVFKVKFIFLIITSMLSCSSLDSSSPKAIKEDTLILNGDSLSPQLISLSKTEAMTRAASVKVLTKVGHGTGTYFKYRGRHIVITASHVTKRSQAFIVVDRFGNKRLGSLIYADPSADFSVILIPAFDKIRPIPLKVPQYNPLNEIDRSVIFSSYPGSQTLRTVRGRISGVEGPYVVLYSTAWPGSSGAGVFDEKGNFVGVLFALTITSFNKAPVLLESMVWVEPYNNISWDLFNKIIENLN